MTIKHPLLEITTSLQHSDCPHAAEFRGESAFMPLDWQKVTHLKLWMSGRWTRYLYQVHASLRSYVCIKKYLYKSMNLLSTQHSELDHQASEWTCEGLNKVQTDSPTIKNRWKWNHSTRKWSLRSCLPVWMLGFFTSTGTLHYTWLADNLLSSRVRLRHGGVCYPSWEVFCQNNVSCLCYDFPGMYPWNTSNASKHICGSVRIHMDSCSHHALIHFAIENKGPQRLGSTEVWILDAWWGKNSFVRCGMVIKFTPFSIQLRPLYSRIATSKA